MKYTYEVVTDELTKSQTIKRTDENGIVSCILIEPSNSDYQAYLTQLAQGGNN